MLIHGYCIQRTIKWWKRHYFIPKHSNFLSHSQLKAWIVWRWRPAGTVSLQLTHSCQCAAALRIHVIPCPTWIRTTDLTWPNTRLLLVVSSCPVDVQTSAFHGLFFLFFLYTTFCHRSTSSQHSRLSSPVGCDGISLFPIISSHIRYASGSSHIQYDPIIAWWTPKVGCLDVHPSIYKYGSTGHLTAHWVKWPAVFHQSLRSPLPKSTKCKLKSTASKAGNVGNYEWVKYTSLIIWYVLFSLFQLFSTHYPFHHNNSQHTVLTF